MDIQSTEMRKTDSSFLPDLTPPQLTKLKQLSLITLASSTPHLLSYSSLLQILDIPTTRALEDLVISAIYAGLLDANLDTSLQRVEVSSTAGRDVAPGDIANLISTLSSWTAQCSDVLAEIEQQIQIIQQTAVQQRRDQDAYDKQVADKLKSKDNMANMNAGGGGGGKFSSFGKGKRLADGGDDHMQAYGVGENEMDLDDGPFAGDEHGGNGAKKSKKALGFRRKRWRCFP